jgi:hypothetical protein
VSVFEIENYLLIDLVLDYIFMESVKLVNTDSQLLT